MIGIFLIRTLPRVRLAMLSLTILSISMMVLGTVYYLKQFYDQNAALDVLPTIFVPLFMFSYGAGVCYKHNVYQIMLDLIFCNFRCKPSPVGFCWRVAASRI